MARPKSPVRLDWVDPAVCSLEYRLKIIGRLPFFKQLPPEAISKINTLFHDHDISADERIYFEGDEADHLYLVAMGKVKLVRNTAMNIHDDPDDIEYLAAGLLRIHPRIV